MAGDTGTPVRAHTVLLRGSRRCATQLRGWYDRAAPEHRAPLLFLATVGLVVVLAVSWGPVLLTAAVLLAVWYAGRQAREEPTDALQDQDNRLQAVYNGLVPYLADPDDPDQLYRPGSGFRTAFEHWSFDGDGQLTGLELRYPPFFRDGETRHRAQVETAIATKAGSARDYLFGWDGESNRLTVTAPPPLPTSVPLQRFVVARDEAVLGFTDVGAERRIPVRTGEPRGEYQVNQLAPVVWRAGHRSAEEHLLVLGQPGAGRSNLLRGLAVQAVAAGHRVVLVEGRTAGDFAGLAGRLDRLEVACDHHDAMTVLREYAALASSPGRGHPDGPGRCWLLVDDLPDLAHAARDADGPDPYQLLDTVLRLGRAAGLTVGLTAPYHQAGSVPAGLLAQLRVRVGLGPLDQAGGALLFDDASAPGRRDRLPAGRGWVRLGGGPVSRLQTPYAPDPYSSSTTNPDRSRMLQLLHP